MPGCIGTRSSPRQTAERWAAVPIDGVATLALPILRVAGAVPKCTVHRSIALDTDDPLHDARDPPTIGLAHQLVPIGSPRLEIPARHRIYALNVIGAVARRVVAHNAHLVVRTGMQRSQTLQRAPARLDVFVSAHTSRRFAAEFGVVDIERVGQQRPDAIPILRIECVGERDDDVDDTQPIDPCTSIGRVVQNQ